MSDRPFLVWDFDGTLADTFHAIRAAINDALEFHDLAPADEPAIHSTIGLSLPTMFERLLDGVGLDYDEQLIRRLVVVYRQAWTMYGVERTRSIPGIADLLRDLEAEGVASAIATSKTHDGVARSLEGLGLYKYFAVIVGDDDVTERKPGPAMVVVACRSHAAQAAKSGNRGVAPEDKVIVIGDTTFDVEMGSRAGADTIGVTWGNQTADELKAANPTHIVDTVDELRRVLWSFWQG